MTKNAILEAALKLPPKQRGKLASQLFESLDGPADPDAPALWAAEIKRRVAEVRAGKAKFVDGDKLLARLKRKHGL
jgi:putative addiction module component (TIGR02574 family)